MKAISTNLSDLFFKLLDESQDIVLISPFLSLNIANKIVNNSNGKSIRLLTRFNLNDFLSGVSSIEALEKLNGAGIEIRGLQGLHAKVYLFDNKTVISTSGNLTNGGFYNNYEYGVIFDDLNTVQSTKLHLDELWGLGSSFTLTDSLKWKDLINSHCKTIIVSKPLPDYGGKYREVKQQTFVKWLGVASDRASLDTNILQLIASSGCNYGLCFSHHPNRYQNNDFVYISIMTDTFDYAIFGRAKTYAHDRNRDVVSEEEIKLTAWKTTWPNYIRIFDTEFLNGNLSGCPMLYKHIVNKLDYEAFESTFKRYQNKEMNIATKRSLRQKQDVKLTGLASILLNEEFEKAKKSKGIIQSQYLNTLYNGNHNERLFNE